MSTLSLDFDTLTIDEVEQLEEIAGIGFDGIARALQPGSGKPMAKVLKAVAFIAARRANPDVTLAEVAATPISTLFQDEAPTPVPPTDASES